MNGVIKTKLATRETVVEIFNADCHKTKLIPISKKPIYIDPIKPLNEGITKELVRNMNAKINGKLNRKIRNKLTTLSLEFFVLNNQNKDQITVLISIKQTPNRFTNFIEKKSPLVAITTTPK